MGSFSESDFTDSSSSDVDDSSLNRERAAQRVIPTLQRSNVFQNPHLEPAVGMVFHSEEEAYNFYNSYAKRTGFSVRKGQISRRLNGTIRSRSFLCSNEGVREQHHLHVTRKPRAIERTNCLARIEYKVDENNAWVVSRVILEHNHLLTSPCIVHMLRSQKNILRGKQAISAGGSQASDFCARKACDSEHVLSSIKYQSSCLHRRRTRDLEKGDTQILLDFLKAKQSEDPSFFYAVQLDEMERLTNFFWVDIQSVIDYTHFGDVVSFDTTYRVNKCDLPFALFSGVNHHKQIIVFGAALLLDESVESFVWLFKAFLFAMSGRQPKTLFTDHCPAILQAINMVFTNTRHRLCIWHIYQNSLKHLASVYNSQPNFQKDFRSCLYESGTEDDFHAGWNNLLSKYDIAGNVWLQSLLASQHKWSLVCNRDLFCATMLTTQWSEAMSGYFRELFNRRLPLHELIQQYKKTMSRLREKELSEDFKSRHTKPVMLVDIPMLTEAAETYTRLVYMDFEDEFKSQIACLCEPLAMDEKSYAFRVSRPGDRCCWVVQYDPSEITVTCSCKKFERMGILCMHALKVLNNNNILQLPSQYVLKRWTKFANEEILDSNDHNALVLRYSQICRKAISFARKNIVSKDVLQFFEQGLDKLIDEVEDMSNGTSKVLNRRLEIGSLEASLEQRKKRKCQPVSCTAEISNLQDAFGDSIKAGQSGIPLLPVINPSHIANLDQKHATLYYIANPAQPGGFIKCTFFSSGPVQGKVASHRIKNTDIVRSTRSGSVLVPMSTTLGQPSSPTNDRVPYCTATSIARSHHHLALQPSFDPTNQEKFLSKNLNLDVNEGMKKQ